MRDSEQVASIIKTQLSKLEQEARPLRAALTELERDRPRRGRPPKQTQTRTRPAALGLDTATLDNGLRTTPYERV